MTTTREAAIAYGLLWIVTTLGALQGLLEARRSTAKRAHVKLHQVAVVALAIGTAWPLILLVIGFRLTQKLFRKPNVARAEARASDDDEG